MFKNIKRNFSFKLKIFSFMLLLMWKKINMGSFKYWNNIVLKTVLDTMYYIKLSVSDAPPKLYSMTLLCHVTASDYVIFLAHLLNGLPS